MNNISRNDLLLTLFSLPLYYAAMVKYGLAVVLLLICSISLGLLVELGAAAIQRREVKSLSFSTWFLLPLAFPPAMPFGLIFISMFLALVIGVVFFGGHEYRLFSPVALGWAFGSLSFARVMGLGWVYPSPGFNGGNLLWSAMVPVIDHPLVLLSAREPASLLTLLAGDFPQPLSNAVPAITIACGLLLLLFRAVDYRTVLPFYVTLFVLYFVFQPLSSVAVPRSLLVGNILFASFFILPEERLTSRTFAGRWIMGILAAVLTFVIRSFSGFPDGVMFAVLLTNIFSALVDEAVMAAKFKGAANEDL